jgi:hypothetical protein
MSDQPSQAGPPPTTNPPPAPQPGSDDPSRWSGGDAFRDRYRLNDRRDSGAVVWGLILVVIGLWFFLDTTLGIRLPRIDWRYAWPVILIVIGGLVVLQGMRRSG